MFSIYGETLGCFFIVIKEANKLCMIKSKTKQTTLFIRKLIYINLICKNIISIWPSTNCNLRVRTQFWNRWASLAFLSSRNTEVDWMAGEQSWLHPCSCTKTCGLFLVHSPILIWNWLVLSCLGSMVPIWSSANFWIVRWCTPTGTQSWRSRCYEQSLCLVPTHRRS